MGGRLARGGLRKTDGAPVDNEPTRRHILGPRRTWDGCGSGKLWKEPSNEEAISGGGLIKFYLGFGADNDFTTGNAGGSAGDLAEATNGTLFLTVKGHAVDAAGNTFIGTGVNIGTIVPTGFGSGLLDVDTSAGGIA